MYGEGAENSVHDNSPRKKLNALETSSPGANLDEIWCTLYSCCGESDYDTPGPNCQQKQKMKTNTSGGKKQKT